jgi:hypothetical protein
MYEHADDPKGIDEMLAVWDLALANIERSKYLRGMTTHKFTTHLKFICQRESFARLIEGGYGNGAHAEPATMPREEIEASNAAAEAAGWEVPNQGVTRE